MKIKTNGIKNGVHSESKLPAIAAWVIMGVLTLIVCIPSVFEYLRLTSLQYIIVIRKEYSHDYSDFIMNLLSAMGDKYGIFVMNWVALAILNQTNYLMLLNVSSVSVGLNIIVKMLIRDARPYFYTSEYQPVSCDFEYGSPSGHAQSVTSFYLSLVTLIIKQYNITGHRKTIYYVLGYFYCFFICFTRIFVGLHTLEQILLGLGLGLISHFIFLHIFDKEQEKMYNGIETGVTKVVNGFLLGHIGMITIATGLYLYIDFYDPAPQIWLDTIAKSWSANKHFISLHFACLNKEVVTFAGLGGYFGWFVKRWVFKWKEESHFKPAKTIYGILLRIIVNIIYTIFWNIPMFLTPKTASIPALLFFRSFIGPFVSLLGATTLWNKFANKITF